MHYEDCEFIRKFFYDDDDFVDKDKKILAKQLKGFAETFEEGRKKNFGYSKYLLIFDTITDKYEQDIFLRDDGIMSKEEQEFFKELMFVKYVQPYIDAGYIVYDGKKTSPPVHRYAPPTTQDYWFPTEKCRIDYEKYGEDQKRKRYAAALEKAAREAGVLSTDGTGKPAEFCNPNCYNNIPIFTEEYIKVGIACFVISLPLLITVFAPFIPLIWTWYICDVYKDYKKRQAFAEHYYRVTHGLPYKKN